VDATTADRRQRDAERTRRALLEAAERRFARDGYAATTVRDIAADAGVNVALISRYFESKAGLFEACLHAASQAMARSTGAATSVTEAGEALVAAAAARETDVGPPEALALFLRTSGDEQAERIRIAALRSFGERIAALAGWSPGGPDDVLLRGQLVLAATMGIRLLRAAGGPEPLMSATEAELAQPLRDLVAALLGRG
jgi:AcrR family transcriptional regulator